MSQRTTNGEGSAWRALAAAGRSYWVIVALALVVGLLIAPFAWQFAATPSSSVAVVPIAGSIDGENNADAAARLAEARTDPSIEAVVLVVDSPGGVAAPSEELYMQVERTAEEMPVVASVGTAATSGAYYAIAPADEIHVKPSSTVGSVGVYVMPPEDPEPMEDVIESGPDKLAGDTRRGWEHSAATLANAFVESVLEYRGDELDIERSELERASVYTGVAAVENGLADRTGDTQSAIQAAADRADLEEYDLAPLEYDNGTEVRFVSQSTYAAADVPTKTLVEPTYYTGAARTSAVPVILMLPPGAVQNATAVETGNATTDEVGAETAGTETVGTAPASENRTTDSGAEIPSNATIGPTGTTAPGSADSATAEGER